MPDITMCKGGDCTLKEYCHRHTAKPDEFRQSYFVEPPFTRKMDGVACAYYMESRKNQGDQESE